MLSILGSCPYLNSAIAVLGKGLGYVLMPTNDSSDERLHMRRPVNRILTESRKRCREEHAEQCSDELPSQLRTISYNIGEPAPDRQVNTIVDRLVRTHDAKLLNTKKKSKSKSNLSKDESDGLKCSKIWLQKTKYQLYKQIKEEPSS